MERSRCNLPEKHSSTRNRTRLISQKTDNGYLELRELLKEKYDNTTADT